MFLREHQPLLEIRTDELEGERILLCYLSTSRVPCVDPLSSHSRLTSGLWVLVACE